MKYTATVFTFLLAFLITSCMENNLIVPSQNENFLFQIQVTDRFHKPISGLEIRIFHHVYGRCSIGTGQYEWIDEISALSVFRISITLKSLDDSIRSIQNKFSPFTSHDIQDAIVGYTSTNGIFRCNNELRFPSIFRPELTCLHISDTILVVLRDTSNGESITFNKLVHKGINKFNIVWDKRDIETDYSKEFKSINN